MRQITHRGSPTDKWIEPGYVFTHVNMVCNLGIQYSKNAHNSVVIVGLLWDYRVSVQFPHEEGNHNVQLFMWNTHTVSEPPAPTLETSEPGYAKK